MSNCWCCGVKITKDNVSREHVIPNALCGKLKSNDLLCIDCNTGYHHLDRTLTEDFKFILANINCKKDRGKQVHIIAKNKNGTEYKLKNGIPELKAPYFPDKPEIKIINGEKQEVYNIIARSQEELTSMRKGLRKKHPDKIVEIVKTEETFEYLSDLDYSDTILSDESFRAVAKIAVNFYILHGGDCDLIQDLISYINGYNNENFVGLYFPDITKDCDVFHHIFLKGDNAEGILYCYIELFGAINYVIILNDNYDGKDFITQYSFNIETRKENKRSIDISLSKKEIQAIVSNEIPIDQLKTSLINLDNVLNSKNAFKTIKQIIIQVLNEEIKKNPNLEIRNIWPLIKYELEKYPYWKNLQSCAYNLESWDQEGIKCSCGNSDYVFLLISINIKGNVLFVLLKTACKSCGQQINFEYKPKLIIS